MLSSNLIVAICDTEWESCETTKFVLFNHNDSLVREMGDFRFGYKHVCGTPKTNAKYLMVDVQLSDLVPDLLFERKDKKSKSSEHYYGYLMEDITNGFNTPSK